MAEAPRTRRVRPGAEELARGVLAGERAALGRAITLVESTRSGDEARARELMERITPASGGAHRIGISGVPGVGKSTFIEALGTRLCDAGRRVAVLSIDPSSSVSGGSILGDKTRMAKLSRDARAFVRPSPTSGSLGGVAARTRETMLLCEAAGYDVVLVETVGVGQSETVVAGMVDFFLVLMLSGAGDELQGIKRGILEVADMLAITKADGENARRAEIAAREYARALHFMTPRSVHWRPPVLTCSALEGQGLDAIWEKALAHREALEASGEFEETRRAQRLRWMWSLIEERLLRALRRDPAVRGTLEHLEAQVVSGERSASAAAAEVLAAFGHEG